MKGSMAPADNVTISYILVRLGSCVKRLAPWGNKPMAQLFGVKLRYLRQQRHLTQADVASKLGFASHVHVSYLEAGQRQPSVDTAIRVAQFFGVTLDYLLRDEIPVEAAAREPGDTVA